MITEFLGMRHFTDGKKSERGNTLEHGTLELHRWNSLYKRACIVMTLKICRKRRLPLLGSNDILIYKKVIHIKRRI